ncbi:MAG: DUF6506 family protein [Bacteroidales bacterium]
MAFKVLFIVRAPNSVAERDKTFLKTESIEVTTIAFELSDNEGIIKTCIEMVEESGIQAIILCPAVTNELVAILSEKIGKKTAIFVGRGDFQSVHMASKFTTKEWFN